MECDSTADSFEYNNNTIYRIEDVSYKSYAEDDHLYAVNYGHDANAPFEVLSYYAEIERHWERTNGEQVEDSPWFELLKRPFTRRRADGTKRMGMGVTPYEDAPVSEGGLAEIKESHVEVTEKEAFAVTYNTLYDKVQDPNAKITDEEKVWAYRALRMASWQGVFFLITTDIIGPFSAPYAFAQLGYGAGTLAYFFFFLLAVIGGQMLYRCTLAVDSPQFPVRTFGDLAMRLIGSPLRTLSSILQSIQLILFVVVIIVANGLTLTQLIATITAPNVNSHYTAPYIICYLGAIGILTAVGILLTQIRSLRTVSWLSNSAVWFNVGFCVLIMAGAAIYGPNIKYNLQSGTDGSSTSYSLLPNHRGDPKIIAAFAGTLDTSFYQQLLGVFTCIFAYGGCMVFVEFMSEMKRPFDFWKGALLAQTFIFCVYMTFGVFVYYFQGQYVTNPANLSMNAPGFNIAADLLMIFSGLIACCLYANIGIKVIYRSVLETGMLYFKFPPLMSKSGYVAWFFLVVMYWAIAYIIGAAIPEISALSTIIASACVFQFTYTFPPLLYLVYLIKKHAMQGDNAWKPGLAVEDVRQDSWKQWSRWKRGIKQYWYVKLGLCILLVACIATTGLGMYAGCRTLMDTFQNGSNTPAFICNVS